MTTIAEQAASMLGAARRNRKPIPDLPAELRPATLEASYAIQDASAKGHEKPCGWKVGPGRDGPEYHCSLLPTGLVASPATLDGADFHAPELELEVGAMFGADLPPRAAPYTEEEVAEAIGSLHLAFELVSSRFQDRKAVPTLTALADQQSNGGIVVGPGLADWRGLEIGGVGLTLTVDGRETASIPGSAPTAAMLRMLTWLANHAAGRGQPLRAGQVVITGARIGPLPIQAGAVTEGRGAPFEPVSFRLGEPG